MTESQDAHQTQPTKRTIAAMGTASAQHHGYRPLGFASSSQAVLQDILATATPTARSDANEVRRYRLLSPQLKFCMALRTVSR